MNYFFNNPNPQKLFTYNISLKKKIIVNESNLVSIKNSLQKSLRKLKFFEAQQSTIDLLNISGLIISVLHLILASMIHIVVVKVI